MRRDTTTIRIKNSTKKRLDLAARLFTVDVFIQALLVLWAKADINERHEALYWDLPDVETGAAAKVREEQSDGRH